MPRTHAELRFPVLVLALAAACGSSDSKAVDAAPTVADAKVVDAAQPDAPQPDAAPVVDAKPGFTLHLVNDLNWCDVKVDNTVYTASSPPDTVYDPGTVVTLFAVPTTTSNLFEWGYWTGTDGQRDGGLKDTDQHATVTMSANQTVTVCCPFASTGMGC